MKVDLKETTPEVEPTEGEKLAKQAGADGERLRLTTLILKERESMISDYQNTIRHTGSLVTSSMGYAYSKAISDIFKLLTKGKE